jgi:shikimate kinase
MIFIIGMPGTGKSYWGSAVAATYGLPFIDLDKCFEERVGMPIADYFDEFGEHEFRLREQEALHYVINNRPPDSVVSCGGGTPVFFDNLEQMKAAGCTVYLRSSLNIILRRLEHSPTRRPLLEGKDKATALLELYDKREPFFSRADHIFDVEQVSMTNFEKIIASCTDRP